MGYALSNHAAVRTQQRGVPHQLIDALMSYADFEAPVGGGCGQLKSRASEARNHGSESFFANRLSAWSRRTELASRNRNECLLQ